MKLFHLTFEQSQYLIDDGFIKRYSEKSILKRFWATFVLSMITYFVSLIVPLTLNSISNNGEVKNFNSWNYPFLFFISLIYLIYVILSVFYRKNKFRKKYLTTVFLGIIVFCMGFLAAFMSFVLTYAYFHLIIAVMGLLLLLVVVIYSLSRLREGLIDSALNQKKFNGFNQLATEKITQRLMLLGGSGLTAAAALVNLSTGGSFNKILNVIVSPFLGFLGYLGVYFFLVEIIKGYYVWKYQKEFEKLYPELSEQS